MGMLKLKAIKLEEKKQFIQEIQEAFQKAYIKEYEDWEETILPVEDIEESFNTLGAEAYFAEIDGNRVGGTIIAIDKKTHFNQLHLLYVKTGSQNCGVGKRIWMAIEKLHTETETWETHTPYFDRRNIHFYVNRCGFKIVEFYNQKHKDPHQKRDRLEDMPLGKDCDFFRLEKVMK